MRAEYALKSPEADVGWLLEVLGGAGRRATGLLYCHFGVCSLSSPTSRLKVYRTSTAEHQLGEPWNGSVTKALVTKLDNLNLTLSTHNINKYVLWRTLWNQNIRTNSQATTLHVSQVH